MGGDFENPWSGLFTLGWVYTQTLIEHTTFNGVFVQTLVQTNARPLTSIMKMNNDNKNVPNLFER